MWNFRYFYILKYHCDNLYFVEFPDPESGIARGSVLAENIEGDRYNLFGEVIEVKPENDCTLIMKTDQEATGTSFEFGRLLGVTRYIDGNNLVYNFDGVNFGHRIGAIREVRLSKYIGLDSEFTEEANNDFDVGFDGQTGFPAEVLERFSGFEFTYAPPSGEIYNFFLKSRITTEQSRSRMRFSQEIIERDLFIMRSVFDDDVLITNPIQLKEDILTVGAREGLKNEGYEFFRRDPVVHPPPN